MFGGVGVRRSAEARAFNWISGSRRVRRSAGLCPFVVEPEAVPTADPHKLLVQQLADRLVRMGWFTPYSPGFQQMIENLRNGSDDGLKGLITACDRHLAGPPSCG